MDGQNGNEYTRLIGMFERLHVSKISSAPICDGCDPTIYGMIPFGDSAVHGEISTQWLDLQHAIPKRVSQLRKKGDELVILSHYSKAVRKYTLALSLCKHWINLEPSLVASIFHNRAIAFMSLGWHEDAVSDCDAASVIESDWIKPYYVKGTVLHRLGRLREALRLFTFLARARPDAQLELPSGLTLTADPHSKKQLAALKKEDLLALCIAPPEIQNLPDGWIAHESRVNIGAFFFENTEKNIRCWKIPIAEV